MSEEVVSTFLLSGHDLMEWMGVLWRGEFYGRVVPPDVTRQQFFDAVHGVVGDALKDFAEIRFGVQAVELG